MTRQHPRGMQPAPASSIPADAFAVNFVRLAGLDTHKARECEAIARQVIAGHGSTVTQGAHAIGALSREEVEYVHAYLEEWGCLAEPLVVKLLAWAQSNAGVQEPKNG